MDSFQVSIDSAGESEDMFADMHAHAELKCLIANDDEMQLCILEQLFVNAGFETKTARNGFEATEICKASI